MNSLESVAVSFTLIIAAVIFSSLFADRTHRLKCIISSKDGNTYCVRERKHIGKAANLLATTVAKMSTLVDYLKKTAPKDIRTKNIASRYNPAAVQETLPTSTLTAYTENKGQKMAFCLNKKSTDLQLVDEETLFFVALHELSHLATNSVGHNQDFWENFKWVLERAKSAGIYAPIDYKKTPEQYCGMNITDNPYYDLA